MIEVTLYLSDPTEINMFAEFAHTLAVYRAAKDGAETDEPKVVSLWTPAENTRTPAGVAIEQALTEAVAISQGEMEAPRRTTPVPASAVGPVTQAQLEEALKAYGRAKGFPAARALLDEYTKGKLGDVPAEKHAELYAKLTA